MSICYVKNNKFKSRNYFLFIFSLFCLFHVTACKRKVDEEIVTINGPVNNLEDLKIPNGFNYQTTRTNNVKITLLDA